MTFLLHEYERNDLVKLTSSRWDLNLLQLLKICPDRTINAIQEVQFNEE